MSHLALWSVAVSVDEAGIIAPLACCVSIFSIIALVLRWRRPASLLLLQQKLCMGQHRQLWGTNQPKNPNAFIRTSLLLPLSLFQVGHGSAMSPEGEETQIIIACW